MAPNRHALARALLVTASVIGAGLSAAPGAAAFDTAPHSDITRDALAAEGFNDRAIGVAQVSNWFDDLYDNAEAIPFSGHAGPLTVVLGGALFDQEDWDEDVVQAALHSHFDSTDGGYSNAFQLDAEWDRLRRTTGALAREARDANDPELLLTVLGASLHEVQDFYAHTNWVEARGAPGFGGPGWAEQGLGGTPTWFDVPAAARQAELLYTGGSTGIPRDHGSWKADGNRSLAHSMAKDWQGRPLYTEAHVAAYFATRQWVAGIRAWVGDEAFWERTRRLQRERAGLRHDLAGALNIGVSSGHWQGQGEACNPRIVELDCGERSGPGGNLLDLNGAIQRYFRVPRTFYRRLWEDTVTRLMAPAPTGPVFPVVSTRELQARTQFVRLDVTRMAEIDNLDIPGRADLFIRARIAGQPYISAVINAHDSFRFRRPNAPYSFLRSVLRTATFDEPVRDIRVQIRTGDVRFAGTDDDVFLRISGSQRFALDKRLYDDFERGDLDTYSVPIDAAIARHLSVGDIERIQIEKSRDGVSGGWRLGGVRVWVNGRLVVRDDAVNRWLEDGHRTWRAPGFVPTAPRAAPVPIQLALWEQDPPIRGGNQHADTHPWDRREDTADAYAPGPVAVRRTARGGSRFGGRLGDGDRATFTYVLSTYRPVVADPPPPPPPTPPDLRLTAFTNGRFAVINEGGGAAGPFLVSVTGVGSFEIPGLAAGATAERTYVEPCREGVHTATADSTNQIAESDETDNGASYEQIC